MPRVPPPSSSRYTGRDELSSKSAETPVRGGVPLKDVLSNRRASKHSTLRPSVRSLTAGESGASSSRTDENIKVCVRLRPMNEREERHSGIPAWTWKDNTIAQAQVNSAPNSRNRGSGGMYTYDHLFDPMSTTEDIYESAVRRVILATMSGYHGSVFAYGQTSTGKTHTMQGTEEQPGVIPLAIEECFSYISASNDDREFLFRVSYLEIYNEQINDLLCPASTLTNVRILESKKLGVQLQGVKEEVVISPQQVYALISAGEAQRHVGSTDANKNSSRSHTIFRMVIESRSRSSKGGRSVMSTLSLVDLAGSESVRHSNTQGQRQIEGGFINKSLLTLGKVVSMLTEEGDKGGYIPYRDSKLTRLLQPSLGGNAQITIICTVTPALMSSDETHNTLKFANRAKGIKNHAAINEVHNEKTLLKKYLQEIAQLKEELARAKAKAEEASSMPPPPSIDRLSVGSANGSPSTAQATSFDAGESDDVDDVDAETQLQSTIAQIERLILTSRKVKKETPGAPVSIADVLADGIDGEDGDGGGGGRQGEVETSEAGGEGVEGSNSGARGWRPPTIDRSALISRRQSTSFFDTKPVFSARDSKASFSRAWNGTGAAGGGGTGGMAVTREGVEDEDDKGARLVKTARASLSRQHERFGFRGDDDVIIGTPPTVDGSAGSSSGSPPKRRAPMHEAHLPRTGVSPTRSTGARSKSSMDPTGSLSDVDLESELERVHTELRNFLQKKRSKKAAGGGGGSGGGVGGSGGSGEDQEVAELRQKLQEVEIGTVLSQADSNFLQKELEEKEADIAECMDLLEEMERQQKVVCEENLLLKTENELYRGEIARLTAILAARERELHDLKGVTAAEETF